MPERFLKAFLLLVSIALSAQPAANLPQIMITDVRSSQLNPGQRQVLTDLLRTELFKTGLFRIVERGVMEQALGPNRPTSSELTDSELLRLGQQLKVQQLLVVSLEQFGANRLVVNLRIIDVATNLLSYTENLFLPNQDRLFEAVADLVKKIQLFYEEPAAPGGDVRGLILARWMALGTEDALADQLVAKGYSLADYLELRQYDISFTPAEYLAMRDQGLDKEVVKNFLQNEIPYRLTARALRLGITDLTIYKNRYRTRDYGFEEYLDAYEKGITSIEDFQFYREGFARDRFVAGFGGVSNDWPVATAGLKFFMGQLAWERFLTSYQRDVFKGSIELGSYLMQMVAPIPYIQLNTYLGSYPFYLKLAAGAGAEVILGGHMMAYGKVGFEIGEVLDISLLFVPVGTQPKISYTDLRTPQGEPGYAEIIFPYVGFLVTLKPSNWGWTEGFRSP